METDNPAKAENPHTQLQLPSTQSTQLVTSFFGNFHFVLPNMKLYLLPEEKVNALSASTVGLLFGLATCFLGVFASVFLVWYAGGTLEAETKRILIDATMIFSIATLGCAAGAIISGIKTYQAKKTIKTEGAVVSAEQLEEKLRAYFTPR